MSSEMSIPIAYHICHQETGLPLCLYLRITIVTKINSNIYILSNAISGWMYVLKLAQLFQQFSLNKSTVILKKIF